ncbi:MAG: hypothetical protein R3C02_08750, partial [Planctomycetaceae bacterium]
MLNAFMRGQTRLSLLLLMSCLAPSTFAEDTSSASEPRTYRNTLTRLENPAPLLADHPKFVQPVKEV